MKPTFCAKMPDWHIIIMHNIAFGALSKAYVSKCKNIIRHRRSMVRGVFAN